ncbi:hypothetical protein KC19_2G159400 [Ceratodon purpureus]|uniref:Uncharacterized protein n=1 Tax=Ceratodon purpureus TaxID=3225 RepID=A0A8T0IX47_CERPU|nr:hypothetical protein KC19_2G159400 [Ceratodon purpureus]
MPMTINCNSVQTVPSSYHNPPQSGFAETWKQFVSTSTIHGHVSVKNGASSPSSTFYSPVVNLLEACHCVFFRSKVYHITSSRQELRAH